MSNSGKQSPLGVNVLGALMQSTGININSVVTSYVGTSKTFTDYTFGSLCNDTVLNKLTMAINQAFVLNTLSSTILDDLIKIGSTSIPALGNTPPNTYTFTGNTNPGSANNPAINNSWLPWVSTTGSTLNTYVEWGYIKLFALQAWNEFNYNGTQTQASISYKDFLSNFITLSGFTQSTNASINAISNATTQLTSSYSNMNDLMTGQISGVNLATGAFGQDLIKLGKALDLSTIGFFGLPSNLLKTLQQYNAINQSLSLALLASGLTASEIQAITGGLTVATTSQEQKIYGAFLVIVGQDLYDVLVPLNCKLKLDSLADLLNVKKLFPTSYTSLTVPVYNTTSGPTNSKTYYPIYDGDSISSRLTNPALAKQIGPQVPPGPPPIESKPIKSGQYNIIQDVPIGFGSYLINIIPTDQAIAAGAFSYSMQQIKNITQVSIEKFAQVVATLETSRDLNLIGGTNSPVNPILAQAAFAATGKGAGPNGTYTMSDFFGCMSGLPYAWSDIQTKIQELQTSNLQQIYNDLYNQIIGAADPMVVQALINQANIEILDIYNKNTEKAKILNTLWNNTGIQLTIEQTARSIAITPVPVPKQEIASSPDTQINFVDNLPQYGKNTNPHMEAQTLEAISDWTTIGGQSLVGLMRESRNKDRLSQIGIPLDDNIDDTLNPQLNRILLINGTVPVAVGGTGITVPNIGCTVDGNTTFTMPSALSVITDTGNTLTTNPNGYYNPNDQQFYITNPNLGGTGGSSKVGETTVLGSLTTLGINNQYGNVLGPYCNGTGPDPNNSIQVIKVGPRLATGQGVILDNGNAMEGSLAGSPYKNLIPDNLNSIFISGVLTPSDYNVDDALAEVIRCNCDCWLK